MRKIKRRARQLGLTSKSGVISWDNTIELMKKEEILKGFPHAVAKAGLPLHQQPKEIKDYISMNVKFVPETLMEKADYTALKAMDILKLKDANFSAKKMGLGHAFTAFYGNASDKEVFKNWIPPLCGTSGKMCHQHPSTIEALYNVAKEIEVPTEDEKELETAGDGDE